MPIPETLYAIIIKFQYAMKQYYLEKNTQESVEARFLNYSQVQDFYYDGYRIFPQIIQCEESTSTQFCVENIYGRTLLELIQDPSINLTSTINVLRIVALQCKKLFEERRMIVIDRHADNIIIEDSGNIRQIDMECVAYISTQTFVPNSHGFIGPFLSRTYDWSNPFGSIIRDFIYIIDLLSDSKKDYSINKLIEDMETHHGQRKRLRSYEVEEHNPIRIYPDYSIDDFLISLDNYSKE